MYQRFCSFNLVLEYLSKVLADGIKSYHCVEFDDSNYLNQYFYDAKI
jgi:hypothetical protein